MKRPEIRLAESTNLSAINDIKLASDINVGDYLGSEQAQDKREIAQFIYDRFAERYIIPLENVPQKHKHGFTIMAVCCLMIEAMVSFRQGYPDTMGKSKDCFEYFFQHAKQFSEFRGVSTEFYDNVRCGLLHQAETKGGWRIRRNGPLFNKDSLMINATEFLARLKIYLSDYQQELEQADWDNVIWVNLREKMNSIIDNCRRSQ